MHSTEKNTSPVVNTDLFLTSFIAMQEMLSAAVSTRAAKDQVSIGRNISFQWTNVQRRLDSMLDQAKRAISAVHVAAQDGHRELPVEKGGSDACNASTCMSDFIDNFILIRSAVATRGDVDGEAHGPASEAYWKSVLAKLDVMHGQARSAIAPMMRAADVELLAEPSEVADPVSAALSTEVAHTAPNEGNVTATQAYGVGAHEYTVLLTLDTTAHREVKVKADDIAHARRVAHGVAQEEQGAHFEMNEGNWVYPDQIHSSAVFDSKGVEVWNDGPVNLSDLDKFDQAVPGQSM